MRRLLIAAIAASITVPVHSAVAVPAKAEQDLQCFVIASAAAGAETDPKKQQGDIVGIWYFLGKLDGSAPGLDLAQAMPQEIAALKANPKTPQIGAACQARLSNRADVMEAVGKQLHNSGQ